MFETSPRVEALRQKVIEYMEEHVYPNERLFYEQASQLPECAYQANLELANLALNSKDYRQSAAHLRVALNLQRSTALQDYLARVSALVPDHEN